MSEPATEGDALMPLVSVARAMELLEVSRSTVERLYKSQALQVVRVGRAVRIPSASLLAYVRSRAVAGGR